MGWRYASAIWYPGLSSVLKPAETLDKGGIVFVPIGAATEAEVLKDIVAGKLLAHFTVMDDGRVFQHFYPEEVFDFLRVDTTYSHGYTEEYYVQIALMLDYTRDPGPLQLGSMMRLTRWLLWAVFPTARIVGQLSIHTSTSVQGV